MTEAKHTPGPWKVCHNMDGDLSVGTDELDPWFIAEMCLGAEGDDRPDDPADANARLIAAAPDTLAALNAVPARGDFANADDYADAIEIWWLTWAEPAITKATGG